MAAATVSGWFVRSAASTPGSVTLVAELISEHGEPSVGDYAWADEALGPNR